jgi:glucose-6-phosphate dehydrogenase assembly protein OpcA
VAETVWSEQDTTPGKIEAALRNLLTERYRENRSYAPARVLNLVVVVDREWRGEVVNRLERVGRYHPSRTIICAVEPGRTTLDAIATVTSENDDPVPGQLALTHERVEILIGEEHLPHLDTIVDPIVVTDLATVVWSPHDHPEAVDSLMQLAQVVLLDSVDEPDVAAALERVGELADRAYVVDLAWLRSTPWRERISATFDPPAWRPALKEISGVTVRHQPASAAAALLVVGWLASRLEWDSCMIGPGNGGTRTGTARHDDCDVVVRLEPQPRQEVPGLAGVTLETLSGITISLDRGPGGLTARRHTPQGDSTWTVLGASRGEGGILGEGVRQALLRDPTYRPALDSARAMLP